MDCHSPWISTAIYTPLCQSNSGVLGYSDIRGMGGYSSYPWRVAIHGWSGDCQSNFGVRDIGGGGDIALAIHGWSGNCQSNSVYGDTLT